MNEEDLCEHCGRCCILKRDTGRNQMYATSEYCEHLHMVDGKSRCAVYDNRHNEKRGHDNICLTARDAYSIGALPKDCPYVKYYGENKKYKCKVINYK